MLFAIFLQKSRAKNSLAIDHATITSEKLPLVALTQTTRIWRLRLAVYIQIFAAAKTSLNPNVKQNFLTA